MKKISAIIMALTAAFIITGCASKGVSRVDASQEIALSDKWNDKDSSLVSEEMILDMLSFPWVEDYYNKNNSRKPTVTIQKVRNKSHEHIATDTFINDLKRAIIRSGKADFVVGGSERQALRDEKQDQAKYSTVDTQAAIAQETGANFALSGSINSIVDEVDGSRVTFYQVDLKLIEVETNREVWNGQKKIKKLMQKSSFGF